MRPSACALFLFFVSSLHAQSPSDIPLPGRARNPSANAILGEIVAFRLLEARSTLRPPRPPAVSVTVRQLLIPPKAVKEFERWEKSLRSGDVRSAAGHLERAIQIYPNFVEARNNLGASYIDLHDYEKAVVQFHQAIAINPNYQEPYANLSLALFLLQRLPEAEQAARHALDLNPQANGALYNLGRILVAENENTLEAVEALRQASAVYPDARLPLALALSKRGSIEQAAAELREYLKSPDPAKRHNIELWLALLTRSPKDTDFASENRKP
jgi:tetratricopeptide (TPR) repeat protein